MIFKGITIYTGLVFRYLQHREKKKRTPCRSPLALSASIGGGWSHWHPPRFWDQKLLLQLNDRLVHIFWPIKYGWSERYYRPSILRRPKYSTFQSIPLWKANEQQTWYIYCQKSTLIVKVDKEITFVLIPSQTTISSESAGDLLRTLQVVVQVEQFWRS